MTELEKKSFTHQNGLIRCPRLVTRENEHIKPSIHGELTVVVKIQLNILRISFDFCVLDARVVFR